MHPSHATHWVCYLNENYSYSYGCVPPKKLSKFFLKRNGYCLYTEHKIQGLINKSDSYCPNYCLFIDYLTKVEGFELKSVVLNLFYQRIP